VDQIAAPSRVIAELTAVAAAAAATTAARMSVDGGLAIAPRSRPSRRRARRSRGRAAALHAEVPQLLDLLAAGSTAGLSAELSVRQATTCLRGPLGDDLVGVLGRVDLGTPWRTAFADYVQATGDRDLRRTIAVLARSETLGVSLRDATRDLATSVRQAHRADTLERARTAPVKMLFPLVFLILPAFLLLTVVPVLITTVRAI
jgi:tight adherence protein C